MIFFSLTGYVYTLVMWITFFFVPKKFGMVRKNYITRGDKM